MENTRKIRGILLVALSGISYGFLPTFTKIAYAAGTSTYTLLLLRFSIGSAFMFLMMQLHRMPMPSKKDMLIYYLLGAFGYTGQSLCYFLALNYVSSSTVCLLLYTYPAIVMLGSAVLFREKITFRKMLSLCLALAGAFVIVGNHLQGNLTGIVLALLCAVLYAGYILASSAFVKEGQAVSSSAFIMLGSASVYGIMNLFAGFQPPVTGMGYLGVAMVALVSTVIAFWTFFTGMEITGPSIASFVSTLEPVTVCAASVIILSEPFTIQMLIGAILVLCSLFVTMLPEHSR